ncbi:MAG: GNAT family N-acetyltransferase [Polyangiaceae bacterium]|nr:GNAT family N-acetyltransferase [Polyangiaceae bacterium]
MSPPQAPRSSPLAPDGVVTVAVLDAVRGLGAEPYRRLAGGDPSPFLRYEWLDALEQTGCAVPDLGWLPAHLVLRRGDCVLGFAPAYLKGNSDGEFVFDHGWARFAEDRLRIDYYPKLLLAVPFTPATSERLLVAPGEDPELLRAALARALPPLTESLGASGAHVLFTTVEDQRALAGAGLIERHGVQLHWRNEGYRTFDEFLARFSSKRRVQLKRELAEAERTTRLERLDGAAVLREGLAGVVFELYLATVEKFPWGRQYLTRRFFEVVCQTMPESVLVVLARDRASERPIAMAFSLVGGGGLYGRYWGAREERPFLHFVVCYYEGVRHAIERGLRVFEPGAGGEHKGPRGFEATVTRSAHHLRDRRLAAAVADFCQRERAAVTEHVARAASPFAHPPAGSSGAGGA